MLRAESWYMMILHGAMRDIPIPSPGSTVILKLDVSHHVLPAAPSPRSPPVCQRQACGHTVCQSLCLLINEAGLG